MIKRKYLILSELSRRLKKTPILVGGSAVELYTAGERESIDLDLLADRGELVSLLEELGFKEKNDIYYNEDVAIDIVGSTTKERIKELELEGVKEKISVVSVEDLIVDRLCACKFWNSERDCDHAEFLLRGYEQHIDRPYLKKRAREEDVEDKLAEILQEEI
ncbi:MAG: UbiD family decarboxylase [Candidatus Altiarchaeota archaeon]|nr:UbiD family decarboxylase [Candidatus Altiarchaeota archaeon]